MFVYQIHIPIREEGILENPTFVWMLTPHYQCHARYKVLKWIQLGGYKFDIIIFDFNAKTIRIFMRQQREGAIEELMRHFSYCTAERLGFPIVKNKKSSVH